MAHPDDAAVVAVLRARGAAPHVVARGGAGLIEGWRRFVEQVETGYALGLDDYRNDLDIRTLIEAAGLSDEVAEEDRRLRGLLAHTDTAIWSSDVKDAFWVRGYPANASGELLEDLEALKGRAAI
jgi:hypothetical protein